jgi:hypothetical protein
VTAAAGSAPDVDAQPQEAARSTQQRDAPGRPSALLLVVAPFAVLFVLLAIRAATTTWFPVHDFAFFDLRVGDVGTPRSPLVGPYSRFGWSHPGPLLFELLAIPSRLLGGRPQGMLLGAVALNATAVLGILVLARRRGGTAMLVTTAVAIGLLLRSMGTDLLLSPWNPWIIVLPMVLLLVLAWSIAVRDWRVLPFTAFVASFLVQTHVASTLVVATALLVGGALAIRAPEPAPDRWSRRRILVVSALILVVLWLPPVVDLLFGTRNLGHLGRYFVTDGQAGRGVGSTIGIVASEVGLAGPWLRGPEELEPFTGTVAAGPVTALVVASAALGLAAFVTWRRRDRAGLSFVLVATGALLATVLSIGRLDGPVLAYLVRFTWAVACVVWLSVVRALGPPLWAAVASRVPPRAVDRPRASGRIAPVVSVASCLIVVVAMVGSWAAVQPPEPEESAALQRMSDAVVPVIAQRAAGRPVLVRPAETEVHFPEPSSRGLAAGTVAQLHRAGVDARIVETDWQLPGGGDGRQFFGDARVQLEAPTAGTVTVVSGSELDTYVPAPGSIEIYRDEDRAAVDEIRRLETELARAFTEAGHPEAIAAIPEPGLRWVSFSTPELGRFDPQIQRLLDRRMLRREAVYWHAG